MTANAIEGAFKYAEEKTNARVGMKIIPKLEELEIRITFQWRKVFISYHHNKEKVEFYSYSLLRTG